MGSEKNRNVRLIRRPLGLPAPADFQLVESQIPSPNPGQVLVRNLFMSVDPYMRGRMADRKSYFPPFQLGEVLQGRAVGKVTAGEAGDLRPGDYVSSMNGWREWFVSNGEGLKKIDPASAPLEAYLSVLGATGMTAYIGLTRIDKVKDGDRVFVSDAAGAVGMTACQIARNRGAHVIGSAGSDEKCAFLRDELKIGAINYRKTSDLAAALADAFPAGIDLYFDNVGGGHLAAALDNMRVGGRIVVCGMIGQYNTVSPPPAPVNLLNIGVRSLTMRGFIFTDHLDLTEPFEREMRAWIAEGKMIWRQTVITGIENAPAAFIGLFKGENFGKMLVKLGEDE
ncbi:MAG TPA: NADP-dependent oxidoreductase [Rhizomicrobium sp.]